MQPCTHTSIDHDKTITLCDPQLITLEARRGGESSSRGMPGAQIPPSKPKKSKKSWKEKAKDFILEIPDDDEAASSEPRFAFNIQPFGGTVQRIRVPDGKDGNVKIWGM